MKIGMTLQYAGGFKETVEEVRAYEHAGIERVFVPEAYGFDAISQLGYIAARTNSLEIASGVMQLYSRTPTLTAMTAAGLDYVSDGRFMLGIGASGPQVVEGFHGVAYDSPLGRTREIIEICRQVWRRESLKYDGEYYQIPLSKGQGTGLGKPLALINRPVRADIPIMLAALGPKNVALAAELADAWAPLFYLPERAAEIWRDSLDAGAARRRVDLAPLEIIAGVYLASGPDLAEATLEARRQVALYVGGMGAPGKNFYNQLACRYGFADEAALIQDLYLSGRKDEAAKAVPEELLFQTNLLGSRATIEDRLAALSASGVTALNLTALSSTPDRRLADIRVVRELLT